MPILIAVAALLFLFLLMVLSIPFSILMRYRQGTKRRKARAWIANVNFFSLFLSVALFLVSAAALSVAAPGAFTMSLIGLAVGGILGLAGLGMTRWETSPDSIFYTPHRLLILTITVVVTTRIGYGFYRAWNVWGEAPTEVWLIEAGAANSLAFGGIVIGYYLVYWAGMRSRLRLHRIGRSVRR